MAVFLSFGSIVLVVKVFVAIYCESSESVKFSVLQEALPAQLSKTVFVLMRS